MMGSRQALKIARLQNETPHFMPYALLSDILLSALRKWKAKRQSGILEVPEPETDGEDLEELSRWNRRGRTVAERNEKCLPNEQCKNQ